MNRTRTTALNVLALTSVAVLGLLPIGCGQNRAETVDPDGPYLGMAVPEDDDATAAGDEVRARDEALRAREESLAARERAFLAERQALERERETPEEVALEPAKRDPLPVRPRRSPDPAPIERTLYVRLPSGTPVDVEFAEYHSSGTSEAGDPVNATVAHDVVVDGMTAIPAGSELSGQVTEAVAGRKIGGQARLSIRFDTLRFRSGETVPIETGLVLGGKSQVKKDAATIGGSVAGGAILGSVIGGGDRGKRAAVGAVVGAAVGTVVASRNSADPAVIEKGASATLVLDAPVEIAVPEARPRELARAE